MSSTYYAVYILQGAYYMLLPHVKICSQSARHLIASERYNQFPLHTLILILLASYATEVR